MRLPPFFINLPLIGASNAPILPGQRPWFTRPVEGPPLKRYVTVSGSVVSRAN